MLQLNEISSKKDLIIKGLNKRYYPNSESEVTAILSLDEKRKNLQSENDATLQKLNALSKTIGGLMKDGRMEEAESIKVESSLLKEKSRSFTENLAKVEEELQAKLYLLPNVPNSEVPEGKTPEDNVVVYQSGQMPDLPEDALPHWEIISKYDIIDFELGTKITGAGFPVYKGKGARLQRALVNFFLDEALKEGYTEIQPPIVINEASGYGTGQLPDKDGQMYKINEENFFLIPTAEVPITNMYRDVILNEEQLPVKNVGYTPCFRREAGSWGAHVRGLNRLHQFDKVEIVRIERPENSYRTLEEMSQYIQGLLKKLKLPYRVLNLCAGDLGFTSAQTFDMEVYSAAQAKWLEVSSVSNFETFQANRLKLRYRGEQGAKPKLLHTLNGSALALPRILAAILENNQTQKGIKIPEVLVPYTGFDTIS